MLQRRTVQSRSVMPKFKAILEILLLIIEIIKSLIH